MNFIISQKFKKTNKKILKKYPFLKKSIIKILKTFSPKNNISLGSNLYKIRFSPREFPHGKNKSFRLIVYLYIKSNLITPIGIYFKGDRENIPISEIHKITKEISKELTKWKN